MAALVQMPQQQVAPVTAPAEAAVDDGVAAGVVSNQPLATALYVGDLEMNVIEADLYDMFSQIGPVVSVRVCRDASTRMSLGYAYVNFGNPVDATRALEILNYTPINSKPIRIMYSNRDPSARRSGAANIFIKNLDKSIDNKALFDTFSVFGNILTCKVASDSSGQSKGYGFVQYEEEEAAQNAIERLNGMLLNDKKVYVGPFLRKQEREGVVDKAKFNNVFVKNLSEYTTEDDLKMIFGQFGEITSAVVVKEGDGKSKCFGFVNFDNPDDAAQAVQELNGRKFDDKEWFVGKALKKSEREIELKGQLDQNTREVVDKYQGLNLYLKNLDDGIGDSTLKELFSDFGTVTSCKVMRDPNGKSRGTGFVSFSSPEEASQALAQMHGKWIGGKLLYVAFAQRKEDRRAMLQSQFSQMHPVAVPPPVTSGMPICPPGAPGLGQQLFFGQGPRVPYQAGYGYQELPFPGSAPMPSFFSPMGLPVRRGQRTGGWRSGGGHARHTQQHMPLIQPQMLPRGGRGYRHPTRHNTSDGPMPGIAGGTRSVHNIVGGQPIQNGGMPPSIPVGALTPSLANASPEQQRTILGENLYPLVDYLEHDHAAKLTGMLLEMDQVEILHLLQSPEALKAKVSEAMEVLRNVRQQQQTSSPADQFVTMTLNEGIVS
ncbi:hypothetical protein DsansV1_C14g0130321 [Dioscorea sansibarensis]